MKCNIFCQKEDALIEHVENLTQQGHFLAIASAQQSDAVWKYFIYDMRNGTMKFLLNDECLLQK